MLAGNSFISLARTGEQIDLCQQSPKMLKTASESFIHALMLFLGLFLKIPRCVPVSFFCSIYLCISRFSRAVFWCAPGFGTYRSQPSITAAYYKCLRTRGLMLRTRERETRGRVGEDPGNEVASLTEKINAISLSYHLK